MHLLEELRGYTGAGDARLKWSPGQTLYLSILLEPNLAALQGSPLTLK